MERLKDVVGDARIVSLGEATHGTREFFRMKHRMLEFLATEMRFSIFSIEANMPEAYRLNDYVLNGVGDPKKLLAGMYGLVAARALHAWREVQFPPPWQFERSRIEQTLRKAAGRHLIIVHYARDHNPLEEWVYNAADIDHAPVIWAREMADMSPLLDYFGKSRRVWLIEADRWPRFLTPCRAPGEVDNSARAIKLLGANPSGANQDRRTRYSPFCWFSRVVWRRSPADHWRGIQRGLRGLLFLPAEPALAARRHVLRGGDHHARRSGVFEIAAGQSQHATQALRIARSNPGRERFRSSRGMVMESRI